MIDARVDRKVSRSSRSGFRSRMDVTFQASTMYAGSDSCPCVGDVAHRMDYTTNRNEKAWMHATAKKTVKVHPGSQPAGALSSSAKPTRNKTCEPTRYIWRV